MGPAYTRQRFSDVMFRQTYDRVVKDPWYQRHPQHNDRPWPSYGMRFPRTYSQFNEQIKKCREQMDGWILMPTSGKDRLRNKNEISTEENRRVPEYVGWANRKTSWHRGHRQHKIGWFGHDAGGCANGHTIVGCGGYSRGHSMNTLGWGCQHHHGNAPHENYVMGS